MNFNNSIQITEDITNFEMQFDTKTSVSIDWDAAASVTNAINLGADVIRINFSHGTLEDHKQFINWARSSDKQVAIMQDIQGPKIRTGFVC